MIQNFSLIEIFIYVLIWAVIGGLPAFYLALAIDRHPRYGAMIGVVLGIAVGLIGSWLGLISAPATILNAVFIFWLGAFIAGLIINGTGIGKGKHSKQASIQRRVADLAYSLLLPTFIIVFVIVIFPMLWNLLLAFRPIRLRDLPDVRLFSFSDLTLENFERVLTQRDFFD